LVPIEVFRLVRTENNTSIAALVGVCCAALCGGVTRITKFGRNYLGEQKHLHNVAGRERVHNGSGCWYDFRSRLAYVTASDSLDFFPQGVGRGESSLRTCHLIGCFVDGMGKDAASV
jgi:hypothetical protein